MVYAEMVGVAELMTDDNFLSWVENLDEEDTELSTFEIYNRYQEACAQEDVHH